jgi:membrane-associated phospholipid phosphatase
VPTAPPWWAGANGDMPPVRRIMAEAGERFWGRMWRPLYHSLEGNPFAAMPSLHFGTSVMAARVLSEVGRGPGVLGWAYALTLGFGLVYLGEHYVVDLLGGLALAETVHRAAPGVEPLARSLVGMVQRLEPGSN